MTNNSNNQRHNMVRRVETKEDGRILIYYTFETSEDLDERKTRVADGDKRQTTEERE